MKTAHISFSLIVVVLLAILQNLYGQGFVDLNFEAATLVPVPGSGGLFVEFPQAFPGWSESPGAKTTYALYDTAAIDSTAISIMDTNPYPIASSFDGVVIQGEYSAILAAGLGSNNAPTDVTLSQTGMVPVGTESLQFKANELNSGAFTVTLGDQTLSLTVLGTGTNYTLYGANVSQWAGQTADLAFTELAENPHRDDQYLVLDAIQFSPEPIPEPSVIGLFSISGLYLCWRMRSNSRLQRTRR